MALGPDTVAGGGGERGKKIKAKSRERRRRRNGAGRTAHPVNLHGGPAQCLEMSE